VPHFNFEFNQAHLNPPVKVPLHFIHYFDFHNFKPIILLDLLIPLLIKLTLFLLKPIPLQLKFLQIINFEIAPLILDYLPYSQRTG